MQIIRPITTGLGLWPKDPSSLKTINVSSKDKQPGSQSVQECLIVIKKGNHGTYLQYFIVIKVLK